jgi:hypothetical protein
MNNYLLLLGNDIVSIILDNVADLYENDILLVEKKANMHCKYQRCKTYLIIMYNYLFLQHNV